MHTLQAHMAKLIHTKLTNSILFGQTHWKVHVSDGFVKTRAVRNRSPLSPPHQVHVWRISFEGTGQQGSVVSYACTTVCLEQTQIKDKAGFNILL